MLTKSLFGLVWMGATAFACGSSVDDESGGAGGQGGEPSEPVVTELFPEAPPLPGESECKVVITDNLAFEGQTHRDVCTAVEYATSPPSSGDHWPIWAMFKTYEAEVPKQMLVHNLEHGAVLMHYRDAAMTDVVAALTAAADGFGADAKCLGDPNAAPRSRVIIAPDSTLTAPIGLSSWRATYVATCIDPASLSDFITKHYGKGPEDLCREGRDPFADPQVLACGL